MGKLKVFDIVLSAINALVSAAKSILKLIDHMGKIRKRPATSTA